MIFYLFNRQALRLDTYRFLFLPVKPRSEQIIHFHLCSIALWSPRYFYSIGFFADMHDHFFPRQGCPVDHFSPDT